MSTKRYKNDKITLMEEETVDNTHLTKEDCDKLLQVLNLIEDYQRKVTDFSANTAIPLNSLPAYGVSVFDIKKISEVLQNPRLIVKNHIPVFLDEDKTDDLKLRPIDIKLAREKIQFLKDEAGSSGLVVLYFEGNVLKRNYEDRIFLCDFEIEKDPIELLSRLIKSEKPLKRSDFGENKNWSRVVADINERTRKMLKLSQKTPLIINKHGGYEIDHDTYRIR